MNLFNKQYWQHNLWYGSNERTQNIRRQTQYKTRELRLATITWAEPDQSRVWGIDVSGTWDGNVNFNMTKAAGASFAIIKCMDGTVATRYWAENYQRSLDAGLITGSYFWLYPNNCVDCKAQARAVWDRVRTVKKQLPLTVDFEWTTFIGETANPNYTDLDLFVTEFIRLSGYKPMLYSAAGYMNSRGWIPAILKEKFCALWIANYGVLSPQLPMGFNEWDFWQFAASGEAARLAPNDTNKLEVDLDYWNGDLEELQRFAGVVTQPPTNGEPMPTTWYEIRNELKNIRRGPGTNYPDDGDLLFGDKIEVTGTFGGWYKFVRAYRGTMQLTLLHPESAYCSSGYVILTTPPVVDPPPPVPAGPVDVLLKWRDEAGNISTWRADQFTKVG